MTLRVFERRIRVAGIAEGWSGVSRTVEQKIAVIVRGFNCRCVGDESEQHESQQARVGRMAGS